MIAGLVFHGPEVFDTGWAARLLASFAKRGEVLAVLAGTMGRAALHDSGLSGVETPGMRPSAALMALAEEVEVLLFAQVSKTRCSADSFGSIMAEKVNCRMPLIQIECGLREVRSLHGTLPAELTSQFRMMGLHAAKAPSGSLRCWEEGAVLWRRMEGTVEGEKVLVNGINIGTVVGKEVRLGLEGNRLTRFLGVDVKPHGLEKIDRFGPLDLAGAKLSSATTLRRTTFQPRISPRQGLGVVLIDHAGDRSFDLAQGASGAVSVGDDTTAVVRELLGRFGIPVLGIVDGDSDRLWDSSSAIAAPGSLTLLVESDDGFGGEVREKIFLGANRISGDFSVVRKEVLALAGDRAIRVDRD
jgi:hypothetical protein